MPIKKTTQPKPIKKTTQPKPMGAPKKEIDWELAKDLCSIHCTQTEIVSILEIDDDTFRTALHDIGFKTFSSFFTKYSANGKMSLRRKQYTEAMEGNTKMLDKLGDAWLGQGVKVDDNKVEEIKVTIDYLNPHIKD